MRLSQIILLEAGDEHIDYTGIDQDIIDRLKPLKPHIQQWVVREIKAGNHALSVVHAAEHYVKYIGDNRYQEIVRKLSPAPKNILSLSFEQVNSAQAEYDEKYNVVSKRALKRELRKGYTSTILDVPGLKVIEIKKTDDTDGAAIIVGDLARGTKWCVKEVDMANDYLNSGPLHLLLMGDRKWLYSGANDELMNERNRPMAVSLELFNKVKGVLPRLCAFLSEKSWKSNPEGCRASVWSVGDHFLGDVGSAYDYAMNILGDRWPEAESVIMKYPIYAYLYAKNMIGDRWPEAESVIMKDPFNAYCYAKDVVKDRWPEAEPVIMNNPFNAYCYARDVVKGEWPEAEPVIMNNPEYTYRYARDVVKKRWPKGESVIMNSPMWIYNYAKDVVKDRWPEAEPYIIKIPYYAERYKEFCRSQGHNL